MTKASFQFSWTRSQTWQQGYQAAMKDAIAWLHSRAEGMNDPTEMHRVNSAATNLGWDWKAWEDLQRERESRAKFPMGVP